VLRTRTFPRASVSERTGSTARHARRDGDYLGGNGIVIAPSSSGDDSSLRRMALCDP